MAPENTLAGFRQALAVGVTTLELDVGVTRDGHVVIAHDPRLNPDLTRDAEGAWLAAPGPALQTLTLAELQRHDVGRLKPGTRYAQAFADQRPPTASACRRWRRCSSWCAPAGRRRCASTSRPSSRH